VTRRQAGQPKNHEFNPNNGKRFFTSGKAQTGSSGHPASYSMGNGDTSLRGKGEKHSGCEAGHSPVSDARNNIIIFL
jgi:hypothetical protein